MKKRTLFTMLAACCLAAAVLAALPPQRAAAAPEDDIVFVAVDEKLVPSGLSAETMPVWRQGVLYAPYDVFSYEYSGIDLRVYVAFQPTQGRVTLFNTSNSLTFYAGAQRIQDNNTNETMPYTTFYRNGHIYVPLQFTAQFFGLKTYQEQTELGYVFRISGPMASMNDAEFMLAAASYMKTYREEYLKSIAPTPTHTQTPIPTPVRTNPPSTATPRPTTGVPTPIPKSEIQVLLAFCHRDGGNADAILDQLDQEEMAGLFLFRPEELEANADAVRRIVGTGHSIGFLVEGEDLTALEEQLRQGNGGLERIALSRSHIFSAAFSESVKELEEAGWLRWTENINSASEQWTLTSSLSTAVLRAADGKKAFAHILMDDSDITAKAMNRILGGLKSAGYNIRPAVETEL